KSKSTSFTNLIFTYSFYYLVLEENPNPGQKIENVKEVDFDFQYKTMQSYQDPGVWKQYGVGNNGEIPADAAFLALKVPTGEGFRLNSTLHFQPIYQGASFVFVQEKINDINYPGFDTYVYRIDRVVAGAPLSAASSSSTQSVPEEDDDDKVPLQPPNDPEP
ncbi:MAG: hypothetical protein AAFW89_05175, partial [Bacteroidota bacterium]